MGTYDSGQFLARAVTGGVLGGVVAAVWGILVDGLRGMPWWSPLALYSTTFGGLARTPVVASGLTGAVLTGVVWLALLGMAMGALFGLVVGTAGPEHLRGATPAVLGALLGLVVFGLALSGGVTLLSPAFVRAIPLWGRAVAFALMGLTLGACAGR